MSDTTDPANSEGYKSSHGKGNSSVTIWSGIQDGNQPLDRETLAHVGDSLEENNRK